MENKNSESQQKTPLAVQKNIDTILKLENESRQKLSVIEQIADKVTAVAGSAPFILLHAIWFGTWISINCGVVPATEPFDPYPFSFLTLVVSLEAIFLTLLVLMSQNRMTKEADKRAHIDLQVNLLDEQETTLILRMVHRISRHLGLGDETDASVKEFGELTDVNSLAKEIDANSEKR